jgi:hypothetical protein
MKPRGVALAGALAAACGVTRVAAPPAPPAFRAEVARPAAEAPASSGAAATARTDAPADPAPPAPLDAEQAPAASSPPPGRADARPAAQEAPAAKPARPPRPESAPLGWIAGQPLSAEDLLLEWGDVASRDLWMVIDKIVAARLALSEAGRLGIRLAPEAVEQRFAAERAKLEKEVARGGNERGVEEFIENELGFEPERYLERVRRATIRQMLAERAVRAASLASDSVALRLIVVAGDDEKERVAEALSAGRDFDAVAREHSVDDSKKDGGLVPFVVQEERSPLARLAFQTPVGEVAGPLPIADHQFWIRIEERRAPLEGDWTEIAAPVEASLARHPVSDAEFVHWKLAMEGRYPIDLGPLWSLIGAAR